VPLPLTTQLKIYRDINKITKKMAVLERVMQLKDQGISEPQIIDSLKQEGIAPKEIDEALSQSKIKSALNTDEIPQPSAPSNIQENLAQPAGQSEVPQAPQQPIQQTQMQPSMTAQNPIQETMSSMPMQTPTQQSMEFQEPMPTPQTQQITPSYQPATMPYTEQPPTESIPAPYQEQYEENYPEYQPQQPADIETINDIAEQIAEEKNVHLKKQISSLVGFKEEINSEIQRMSDRLTKIEGVFNELQIAILGKIGNYGRDIQNIAKEMHITQDSFSKILNPLTENIKELKKITRKESPAHHETHTTSSVHHKPATHKTTKHKKPAKKKKTTKIRKTRSKKTKKPKIEDYVR